MERKYPKVKDNNEYYERKFRADVGFFNTVATIVERYKQPYSNEDNAATIFNAIVDFANEVMLPISDDLDCLKFRIGGLESENEELKQEKAAVEKIFGIEALNAKIDELENTVEILKSRVY